MKKRHFNLNLSKRDWNILKFVLRHRIVTFEVLRRVFFDGKQKDAVKSTLRRLCGRYRLLTTEQLDARRGYYRLTQRAAALLGARRTLVRPLGPQSLIERFAVLWFITLDRPGRRTLFNPRHFPEQFDLGSHRLPRANFYIEDDERGQSRLGYIVVDHGGHLRRIIRKSVRVLLRFLKRGWFDDYFATGRFTLTVLTLNGTKQKSLQFGLNGQLRESLRYALSRFSHKQPLSLQVEVVPGLMSLIPSPAGSMPVADITTTNSPEKESP